MHFHRLFRPLAALAFGLVSMVSTSAADSSTPAPHGYPRLAFYGSIRGNGYPFYNSPTDTSLDPAVLDKVSRFEEIILDVSPVWPYRPDVVGQLRARNPGAKFLAYVVGHDIWQAQQPDSTVHYPTLYRRLMDCNNGWLYDQFGKRWYAGDVNLAKKDATGRLVIADSLALLWKKYTVDPGIWDGIFFDILCDHLGWSQNRGLLIDYQRAGYSSYDEWDYNWHAATDTIAALMRGYGGPNFIMVGNCAAGTKYSTFNGWMREGFPYETGGEWYTNMFWAPGGYMTDEANFLPPRHNYIFSFQVGTDQYSDLNCRIMRFGLGSATLGDGFGVFGGQDRDAYHADYHNWWYDEYAVDPNTHVASELAKDTGWLGQAASDMYQMIWVGTNPEGIRNPDFEKNVASNWQLWNNSPSSVTRDTTTSRTGKGSARVDIFSSYSNDWSVNFNAPLDISIDPWTTYGVTFWAKASSLRDVPVVIASGTTSQESRHVTIGTEWKQYQIPYQLYGSASLAAPSLQFYLGKNAGSVWLDGVHVQQGLSSVYRRDFQNGTVLVNTSQYDWSTVQMERPFHRILGLKDPITNDGTTSNVQIVPPYDTLFLIGDDITPPAQVKDLHQVVGTP